MTIGVLIVDDSKVMRSMLKRLLSRDPDIKVVGEAADPYQARQAIVKHKPDVMILDIEMPKMDGITFLRKVMASFPIRTLMYSSLTKKNSKPLLQAFEAGAIDVLEKPSIAEMKDFDLHAKSLCQHVRMVAGANLLPKRIIAKRTTPSTPKKAPSGVPAKRIIAIGASTGGTEALKVLVPKLELTGCAVLLVQHLPPSFVDSFTDHLAEVCPFPVKVAQQGETILSKHAYVAPGDFHMEVQRGRKEVSISLHQQAKIFGIRPAADPLFNSVAQHVGPDAVGIILTGMGKDGAEGLLAMKKQGSYNIAQTQKSCVVFGMPKEAIRLGAIDSSHALESIAHEVNFQLSRKKKAA